MTSKIDELVQDVGSQLKQKGLKLATAESCTGGGLCYWLTSVPGSSAWMERGFITYSNAAKQELLGIPSEIITRFGAVSAETACAMAQGALLFSHADISIAITGIAGPDSDSTEKPVGMVWIAIAEKEGVPHAKLYQFTGDRQAIRLQSIMAALEKLRALVAKKEI